MMRMRTIETGKSPSTIKEDKDGAAAAAVSWEVRPGGMLVQKRSSGGASHPEAPNIRVRVKHGEVYHEIYLSSQSSFGDLKKLVSERTGMHPLDQKVMYKNRERDSAAFLDTSGVKDGSKVVVMEDPVAQSRRLLEIRRNAKTERASKSISEISLEVDKLVSKVLAMESIVDNGVKMAEIDVANMIEMLMKQLVKLDGIVADGDVKAQRRIQVRRVQKQIEALDALKIKNAASAPPPPPKVNERPPPASSSNASPVNGHSAEQGDRRQFGSAPPPAVVVSTKWEVFDSLFSPKASATSSNLATTTYGSASPAAKLDWELF